MLNSEIPLQEKTPTKQENQTPETQDPQWFEDVVASYDYQKPKSGQVMEGVLIRIDEEGALVDIGVKRDAIVPARDLSQLDKEFLENLHVGDTVLVFVTNPAIGDRDLQVSLSKGLEYKNWQDAEDHLKSGETINLEIVGYNRGGLIVQFHNLRGFLPFSQVPELRMANNPRFAENLKRELVGSSREMKVIEVVPSRNRLIFSALEAHNERRKKRLESLEKGQIIEGRVASVVDFGVFVDLDGVDGLVHISQLDWKKIKHPSELFRVGDSIQVKVTDVDIERERVSLSRKSLLPSPWEQIGETYQSGDYIEVTITRVVDFGAFARLSEGIEGLIHSSQIGYSATQNPKDAVKTGDVVLVKVLDVNPERRRMALSMRQVPLEKQISWAMENMPETPKDAPAVQQAEPQSITSQDVQSEPEPDKQPEQTPDLPDETADTLPAFEEQIVVETVAVETATAATDSSDAAIEQTVAETIPESSDSTVALVEQPSDEPKPASDEAVNAPVEQTSEELAAPVEQRKQEAETPSPTGEETRAVA